MPPSASLPITLDGNDSLVSATEEDAVCSRTRSTPASSCHLYHNGSGDATFKQETDTDNITEGTQEVETDDDDSLSTIKDRVRFDESFNVVHEVYSRSQFAPEECRSMWYSVDELAALRERVIRDAYRFGKPKQRRRMVASYEATGLEIYSVTPVARARQRRLKHTQQCVLLEQASLLKTMGSPSSGSLPHAADADTLRHVSRICSRFCVKEALQRAHQDEQAIWDELQVMRVQQTTARLFAAQPSPGAMQFFKILLLDA